MSEVVRLSVNLSQETAAALKNLANDQGLSMTEVMRRAISIYKFVIDERDAGRKIHTMDADGRNVREMVMM
jgi:predicted transcriptional regulator